VVTVRQKRSHAKKAAEASRAQETDEKAEKGKEPVSKEPMVRDGIIHSKKKAGRKITKPRRRRDGEFVEAGPSLGGRKSTGSQRCGVGQVTEEMPGWGFAFKGNIPNYKSGKMGKEFSLVFKREEIIYKESQVKNYQRTEP